MKVLVGCEFSGTVRDAFDALGHDAWSCDLEQTESPGKHIQGCLLAHLHEGWDLLIAHPPCTHLASSGARWWKEKEQKQHEALLFVMQILHAPVPRIAIENPISIISPKIRKPDQIIQPTQFGHHEMKTTCLWLKNLPQLKSTKIYPFPATRAVHQICDRHGRAKDRSRTYKGIAEAMAKQWGSLDAIG